MTIKDYYLENFSTDELGLELNCNPTFAGLLHQLLLGKCVYEYIGVCDSIVRERLFEELAREIETSYKFVYDLWLNNSEQG
jgi:hypothetical protein